MWFGGVCTIGAVVVGISWALGSIVGRLARVSSPVSIKMDWRHFCRILGKRG